ncbi:hypothetical protein PHBOTO_000737 [Pseudozyma hubeiensis]|nr:hypothetical protein PHBOTO_000737 [Pseudozyma hubeiensis]
MLGFRRNQSWSAAALGCLINIRRWRSGDFAGTDIAEASTSHPRRSRNVFARVSVVWSEGSIRCTIHLCSLSDAQVGERLACRSVLDVVGADTRETALTCDRVGLAQAPGVRARVSLAATILQFGMMGFEESADTRFILEAHKTPVLFQDTLLFCMSAATSKATEPALLLLHSGITLVADATTAVERLTWHDVSLVFVTTAVRACYERILGIVGGLFRINNRGWWTRAVRCASTMSMPEHHNSIVCTRWRWPGAKRVHAGNVRRHDIRSSRIRMELVERARVDVFGHSHTCVERCTRKVDKLVKVGTEENVVAAPSLLEAALDLNAELARTAFKVFATRFAFFSSWTVEDADKNATHKVLGVNLVWSASVVETAVLHVEAVGADLHFQSRHLDDGRKSKWSATSASPRTNDQNGLVHGLPGRSFIQLSFVSSSTPALALPAAKEYEVGK